MLRIIFAGLLLTIIHLGLAQEWDNETINNLLSDAQPSYLEDYFPGTMYHLRVPDHTTTTLWYLKEKKERGVSFLYVQPCNRQTINFARLFGDVWTQVDNFKCLNCDGDGDLENRFNASNDYRVYDDNVYGFWSDEKNSGQTMMNPRRN